MKNDDIVNVYSKVAEKYAEAFIHELDSKPLDKKLYELFASKAEKNGHCLEIGCGPGEISAYLHSLGMRITGVDKSTGMIEQAKKHNKNITFVQGDVFNLPFENNSIDGIAAPYLIVNFSGGEIKKSFQEMNRVLKSNSPLLIVFHAGFNIKLGTRNFLGRGNKMIFILHSVRKIKKILGWAMFSIEEVLIKEPYKGEITKRAFIFARKR